MAISFGTNRPWGAVSQHEFRRMAKDPRHLLPYRVQYAAIGWADRHGHASFQAGELAALLAGSDGKALSKQSTTGAVSRAKGLDLVSPQSSAACLVLPRYLFQKEKGAPIPCRAHKDRR
ncbi:hypothetical protein [Streptomyces formicae]|uniref:hypothetical protein n=1 Tax=Streptomyces formicae TaxID=1616117 RepID=UPI001F596567|nr:hypothetical protein [Streptomyces formicae]